ncbi:MAG: D-amino acid aminotransferase [Firmicutes bacterium]|nr:D-amino acid aminotransferase [Bacillota bacterium]
MGALGFIDGRVVDLKELVIAMEDRGYQFGDGVYEYTKVYNGKLFSLKPHIDRLYRSLRELRIPAVFTFDEMAGIHERLIAESGITNGGIYLQITRGWAPRAHNFPDAIVPCLTMTIRPSNFNAAQWDTGVGVLSVPDERWLRCDIKSLNLLANVLAKQKAKEAGCYEALQIRDKMVTEGSSSNFFIVKDEPGSWKKSCRCTGCLSSKKRSRWNLRSAPMKRSSVVQRRRSCRLLRLTVNRWAAVRSARLPGRSKKRIKK